MSGIEWKESKKDPANKFKEYLGCVRPTEVKWALSEDLCRKVVGKGKQERQETITQLH